MAPRARMRDPNAAFDRLDANRDGSISRDEFATRARCASSARRRQGSAGARMTRHARVAAAG